MKRGLIYIFALIFACISVSAAKISVSSLISNGKTAKVVKDLNGDQCAVLKIFVDSPIDLSFEGNIVGLDQSKNAYTLYLSGGSRNVSLFNVNMLPIKVAFQDYGVKYLKEGAEYHLTLSYKPEEGATMSLAERVVQKQKKAATDEDKIRRLEYILEKENEDSVMYLPTKKYYVSLLVQAVKMGRPYGGIALNKLNDRYNWYWDNTRQIVDEMNLDEETMKSIRTRAFYNVEDEVEQAKAELNIVDAKYNNDMRLNGMTDEQIFASRNSQRKTYYVKYDKSNLELFNAIHEYLELKAPFYSEYLDRIGGQLIHRLVIETCVKNGVLRIDCVFDEGDENLETVLLKKKILNLCEKNKLNNVSFDVNVGNHPNFK